MHVLDVRADEAQAPPPHEALAVLVQPLHLGENARRTTPTLHARAVTVSPGFTRPVLHRPELLKTWRRQLLAKPTTDSPMRSPHPRLPRGHGLARGDLGDRPGVCDNEVATRMPTQGPRGPSRSGASESRRVDAREPLRLPRWHRRRSDVPTYRVQRDAPDGCE